MFFTNVGRFAAWAGFVLGIVAVVLGSEIQMNQTGSAFADFLGLDTTQKARAQSKVFLSQGYFTLFCSLVLGILTEISRSLASKKAERTAEQ